MNKTLALVKTRRSSERTIRRNNIKDREKKGFKNRWHENDQNGW
ncbi:MAG: hypothetical protein CM1200mP8_5610 [Chloroflexota bacterium]|nr:MAG: hypothetical protein CM1200mP8_5610 [Chloroflexota bacterium]